MQANVLQNFELWMRRGKTLGVKALVMVRFILPLRLLSKGTQAFVDKIDVWILLRKSLPSDFRTLEFHNRSLGLSDECVQVAKLLLRFRKPYVPRCSSGRTFDNGAVASFLNGGKLTSVTKGYVRLIHKQWKQLQPLFAEISASHDRSSRGLVSEAATLLLRKSDHRRPLVPAHFTCNRQSHSVP